MVDSIQISEQCIDTLTFFMLGVGEESGRSYPTSAHGQPYAPIGSAWQPGFILTCNQRIQAEQSHCALKMRREIAVSMLPLNARLILCV